jgi:hypothetical protein
MTTGFYPKAIVKNIPPGSNDPAIKPRIAVLHVAVSNADSLHDYFNGPSGGIESHFYIRFDGTVEQYRSIYFQADAQLDANDFAIGIETAGMAAGKWTDAQLASIKALLLWLHTEAGIRLEECTAWNGEGVGYHTMWGAPSHWTPSVKTCPGPERIQQFKDILIPWMAGTTRPTLFPVRHRVVTSNLYVGNKNPLAGVNRIIAKVKAAFRFVPDVVACQESHHALLPLGKVEDYQLLVASDEGQAGRELAVLLHDRRKLIGTEFHPAADGTGTGVFDHPRGVFVVKYLKRGRKVAVVNTHMGLVPKSDVDKNGPAAVQHAEHALLVARIVQRLQRNGFTVFVTADANSTGAWESSLPAVLARIGMKVTLNHIDLIASDPKRVGLPKVQTIDKTLVGSDTHDAVAISATERKHK